MTYSIKLDSQEVAKLTGDNIVFGRKCRGQDMMDKEMVDDHHILKQLDAGGNTLWVLMLSHRNLSVEEIE